VSERLLTARDRLATVLAPEVLDALDELVSERVEAKLEARTNGAGTPWLSIAAAAKYLGLSERTLERELARGRLRSSTVGRRRLLHRDELDNYVRAAGEE
jgi:excisionase family DNA binding protein